MTDYTDGSSFVGIDADAAAADESIGTWLDHRMWSNVTTMALLTSYNWNPYVNETDALTTNLGHRPYLAVGSYQSVLCFDMWVEPGMNGLKVLLDYNVQSEGTTQNDLYFRVRIDGIGHIEDVLANTDNAGAPSFEDATLTWTFNTVVSHAQWRRCVVDVKSGGGSEYTTVTLASSLIYYTTASDGDLPIQSTGPVAGSLEVKYLLDSDGNVADMLAVDPNSTSPERVWTWPSAKNNPLKVGTVSVHDGSYVQFRSISIQPTYDATSITRMQQTDLAALLPSRGLTAAYHGEAVRALQKRPRCLAVGPSGIEHTVDENWPDNYAQMWTYAQGDGTNQTDALIDEPVFIDGENPQIVCRMKMIGTFFAGYDPGGTLGNDAGLASWDISVTVTQMQDGDTSWATASYSETSTATHYIPVNVVTSDHRALMLIGLLHDYGNPDGVTPENYTFVTREGSLTGNDYNLLHDVEVSVDLAAWTTEQLNGARVEVTAVLNTLIDMPWYQGSGTAYEESLSRITCVGYSVWSRQNG